MSQQHSIQPTIYTEFVSQYAESPLDFAIKKVAFGTKPVEALIDEQGAEADIAVTNRPEIALRIIGETKHITVLLAHFFRHEREAAESLTSQHPDRLLAVAIVESPGEPALVPLLFQLIADKGKEAYERSVRAANPPEITEA